MILVTGTKRSGTSMWMQIVINAGFPFLGRDYMGVWKESIQQANPEGFFESKLRFGINYKNNPNPQNGVYLHPRPTAKYACKVFVPGLIKTDFAFIHRVLATIRPWNEYCTSIRRLLAMEEAFYLEQPDVEGEYPNSIKAILRRPNEHPAMIWWRDNFDLVFDALTRQYPVNIVAYDRLLEAPQEVIPPVLEWCNKPLRDDLFPPKPISKLDLDKAVATVQPKLRTQKESSVDDHNLPDDILQTFQEFYDCFHNGQSRLSKAFREELNETHKRIQPLRTEMGRQILSTKRNDLREAGLSDEEIKKALFSKSENKAFLSPKS